MSTMQHSVDIEWSLGTCNSKEETYEDNKKYLHKCCLKPGKYVLTCINKRTRYGWNNSYIEIQAYRYCDDFMSYQIMQTIAIKGILGITFHYSQRINV